MTICSQIFQQKTCVNQTLAKLENALKPTMATDSLASAHHTSPDLSVNMVCKMS